MVIRYCWGEYDEIEYEYEVDINEIVELAIQFYADEFSKNISDREIVEKVITELIHYDLLVFEQDDEFMDYLKEYFEDAAVEEYEDGRAYASDPLGYYGMHWSDFIKID